MESIVVYFTPLASTKVAAYVGLGLAYHMAIVYTDQTEKSFAVSSGPSNLMAQQTPSLALQAMIRTIDNTPSMFGTLVSDPNNNHSFEKGTQEDYYTQDDMGDEYPHATAMAGPDLSTRWQMIVRSYAEIGTLHLTYSPISQNSNSMAGTALRQAGIPIPFSSASWFAPAAFTDLRRAKADIAR